MLLLNFYTNILVNFIIDHYHGDRRCLFIFTDDDLDYGGAVPAVRIKMTAGKIDYDLIFNYNGCQSVVVYVADPVEVFVEFEHQIRHHLERFNRRRFLIVPRTLDEDFDKRFFALKELNFVSDLLVVLPREEVFELKTHRYVGVSDNNQPVLLDRWFPENQSFAFGSDLYPDKLTNQFGRALKMATFTYEPYSVIGESVEDHHGSELVSAVEFALKYNMTPVPVVNDKDYWGEIFPNWSGNGLLGNLAQDNADIGFSALYTWEICYHYLDLSKPLVRTGITCLVPAPKLAARWLTPLFSYSPELWICVVIVFVAGIAVLSFILLCYNRNKTMTLKYPPQRKRNYPYFVRIAAKIIMKPVLQQSLAPQEIPVEVSSKLVMGLMLVLSLVLTSTYSSGLASIMTLPRYENAINTVEDFAGSGLDWGATQDAWITSIQNAEEPTYVTIVRKFHPTPEEDLREFSKTGKWAFSIERLPFENYAIGDYIREDVIGSFHLMQQDLYWEQCVIMLRKNSVLLPTLDLFILKIFEAGLISQWQNKAVDLYMNAHVQRVVKYYQHHVQGHEVVKLKWSHVQGPFAILAIGYCASLVVFVLEVTMQREKIK